MLRYRLRSRVLAFASATILAASMAGASQYQFIYPPQTNEVKGDTSKVDFGVGPQGPAGGAAELLGQSFVQEVEPNGTSSTATPLGGTDVVARGSIFPNADIDFWSFSAVAGDRVYVATQTSGSVGGSAGSTDSQVRVFDADGTTLIEFDDDDGSMGGLAGSIANATIPGTGTYFVEVRHFSTTTQLRPYHLHFRLQSGSPTPEVEPNDTPATANPLPASGWVSGTRSPAAATEQDWYSFTANAGDTVFLSLDLDPERDVTTWNGRLGIALFGDAGNQILVVDDSGAVDTIDSEAMFMTVNVTGTYFAFVDSASAATGGPTATYTLSVSIHPSANEGVNCTTYTSTDVPQTIGPGAALSSSTITVPGNPTIADLDVSIQLNHAVMNQVDAHLRSPASNDNGLFTDIGAAAVGGQTQMNTTWDDEAAIPPLFTALRTPAFQTELNYRLAWFDGENAGGTWTLDLRDDTGDANGGTLTAWSLRICEPPPPPTCGPGLQLVTVYSSDFETDDGGFTHSGTADEWERGLPATVATTTANPVAGFTTCNSGVNCWKTDLDNTYNISSNQDLLSPSIDLTGLSGPVIVSWAQRYQIETATFDHYNVDFREFGGAGASVRLFEWLDATMIDGVGNPTVNIPASAGWATHTRRVDSLAGLDSELRFHLDTDSSVNFGGVAIDDVTVTACELIPEADLSVTKTDGVTLAIPGQTTTYTITATNNGPGVVDDGNLSDPIPAGCSTFTWICQGSNGGTCTANGSGAIDDTIDLPVGGQVTYLATCLIGDLAGPTLTNTVTVDSDGGPVDPDGSDNTATDVDDLAIYVDGFETGNTSRWSSTQN